MEKISNTPDIRRIVIAEDDDDDFYFLNSAILSLSNSVEILRTKNAIMLSSLMEASVNPDLLILDINMPLKSGVTYLRQLKENPRYISVRVVMYSTSSNQSEIKACYESGALFYIIKANNHNLIVHQFKTLFNNTYFLNNQKPPLEEFIITG